MFSDRCIGHISRTRGEKKKAKKWQAFQSLVHINTVYKKHIKILLCVTLQGAWPSNGHVSTLIGSARTPT